jgi:hypothetical protein
MFLLLMVDLQVNVACHGRLQPLRALPSVPTEISVPITWTIDHNRRSLTAVCQGDITLLDFEDYLDAVVVAGSMPYRKLFDGTRGDSTMTDEEMMLLGARIRAYHAVGPMGPLAIVVATEHTHGLARLFGALAAADRPIKIFRDIRGAQRWLDAQSA